VTTSSKIPPDKDLGSSPGKLIFDCFIQYYAKDNPVTALLDSGADSNFISRETVERLNIKSTTLEDPIPLRLADGELTVAIEQVTIPVNLVLGDLKHELRFYVTSLGSFDVILGHSWLYSYNPTIDWKTYGVTIDNHFIKGRPQNAHRNFRTVESTIQSMELLEFSLSQEVYPFLRPRTIDGEKSKIPNWVLHEYSDVFDENLAKSLPPIRDFDVSIPLKPDSSPYIGKPYALTKEENTALKNWIDDMEASGLIQKESSTHGAPVFFVKQKNKLRPCIDYRRLNANTIKKKFPIPLISELIRSLSKAKVYTALDLKSAYHQLRIRKEDIPKTAFITPFGQYTSNVLLFGSTNAPSDFQEFMTSILSDLIGVSVLVYLDDIIIYSENPENHEDHVRSVLDRLRANKLYCNLPKCQFNLKSVIYLGYVITPEGIYMDTSKVDSILTWPIPTSKKEVRSFLGFTNFYRKFIPNYSDLCIPLNSLLKKSINFSWGKDHSSNFEKIKSAFLDAKVLVHPDESKPFFVETDASDFAIGGILSQEDSDGILRPVCFYSRQLTGAERNYEVYDRELLAIVVCLRVWRQYLQGSEHQFTIFCDHSNLEYFRSSKELTSRQVRWSLLIEEFHFKISYRPGKINVKPDLLSRRADYQDGELQREKILLPADLFASGNPILVPVNFDPIYSDVLNTNIDLQHDWPLAIAHFFEEHEWLDMPEQFLRKCKSELPKFSVKSTQLYRILDDKISTARYVPHVGRRDLMKRFHVGLGHLKFDSIENLFKSRYWWPNWKYELKNFIAHCSECQLDASHSEGIHTPVRPIPPSGLPFERWGIDFIQDLPETNSGNRHIITAIDYATRWVVAKAVPERTTSEMTKFLYENILMNYGCPYEIFSDRASALLSESLSNYMELQTIRHKATTPYHPRTNGMVERMHAMVGHSITTLSNSQPQRWDEFLNQTIFAIRVRTHATTRYSPFYLLYGIEPRIPGDTDPPRESMTEWTQDTMDDFETRNLETLQRARGIAYVRSLEQAKKIQQRHQHVENSSDFYFKINDWVKMKNHTPNKFEFEWKGPYFVVDVGFPGTYWLMDPNGRRLDNTVNQSDLAPWRSSIQNNQDFFHDGTQRSISTEQDLAPSSLNVSTHMCTPNRNMGDCVTSTRSTKLSTAPLVTPTSSLA